MPTIARFTNVAVDICTNLSFSPPTFVGEGEFKEVYRTEMKEDEYVALKIFDPDKCNPCRAEREIQSMLKCKSPFIGKLYNWDTHVDEGIVHQYTIEEFFDDGSLSNRLKEGFLSHATVCKYAITLIQAVSHLSQMGLVHRDIKPDNIMFRSGEDLPNLIDFGLVRDLRNVSLTLSYLQQGPGTPFFASPEQLNNDKHLIDWRSDQFAIGIVLSICMTGRHPFQQSHESEIMAVERVALRQPCCESFIEMVRECGWNFLLRMVQPWPIQRFGNPQDILEALEIVRQEIER